MNSTTALSIIRHLITALQAIQRDIQETQTAAVKTTEPPKQEAAPKETTGSRKPLLTVAEAADYLGISKGSFYRRIKGEKVPHYRLGRRILINEQHLLTWLASLENAPQED